MDESIDAIEAGVALFKSGHDKVNLAAIDLLEESVPVAEKSLNYLGPQLQSRQSYQRSWSR